MLASLPGIDGRPDRVLSAKKTGAIAVRDVGTGDQKATGLHAILQERRISRVVVVGLA